MNVKAYLAQKVLKMHTNRRNAIHRTVQMSPKVDFYRAMLAQSTVMRQ